MNVTVIGAGNLGLAMAAHLGINGNRVTLWNRSRSTIEKLIDTRTIHCWGVLNGSVEIDLVTDDIERAVSNPDVIIVTTPANSHHWLADIIGRHLKKETLTVLNPGRTFGALEFQDIYYSYSGNYDQTIAETQTTIHVCRKTDEDAVNLIALKQDVLISTFEANKNQLIIDRMPKCLQQYLIPARSMIETSIGNVGMILHCAPLLLNTGWTENVNNAYKYYYDGITPSVGRLIEKIDEERVAVSRALGFQVESAIEWFRRTYEVEGDTLYQCIQSNEAYRTIDAPKSLNHRYIFEDIPHGLVPLEAVGKMLGVNMDNTSLIINLASSLMDVDLRGIGRNLNNVFGGQDKNQILARLLELFKCRFEGDLRNVSMG